ncbi:MAG: type VII toxin-antitoxin system MntA family adenylyltransferase antitoxin [Thermoproteota archaeon]
MLSLERIRKAVVKACGGFDCVYVLFFGSRATGNARDYSDVDVAVKFKDSKNCLKKALDFMSLVEEELGVHVDVVPLNIADTIVKYEVYNQGIILFCVNNDKYMDDYINAIDEYLDFEHSFNRFYELTIKEIKNACARS